MKKHKLYLSLSLGVASLLPTVGFAESSYFSLKDGDGFKRFSFQQVGYMLCLKEVPIQSISIPA
ncbi:hypothetical protein F988_01850 [Acinetobacter parvus DSM 16617 = CIP 108168]|uniref:Uncharacterized protein n=1 Tax=Acinetobacter parvus DSM 16617 = CIP 108168 TaxID=981333 RepID=N8RPA9_9GAMM|nr:hypothetical protein F988_01850 [Acinetobacter parvus DSM 16617 = CIP 108168]